MFTCEQCLTHYHTVPTNNLCDCGGIVVSEKDYSINYKKLAVEKLSIKLLDMQKKYDLLHYQSRLFKNLLEDKIMFTNNKIKMDEVMETFTQKMLELEKQAENNLKIEQEKNVTAKQILQNTINKEVEQSNSYKKEINNLNYINQTLQKNISFLKKKINILFLFVGVCFLVSIYMLFFNKNLLNTSYTKDTYSSVPTTSTNSNFDKIAETTFTYWNKLQTINLEYGLKCKELGGLNQNCMSIKCKKDFNANLAVISRDWIDAIERIDRKKQKGEKGATNNFVDTELRNMVKKHLSYLKNEKTIIDSLTTIYENWCHNCEKSSNLEIEYYRQLNEHYKKRLIDLDIPFQNLQAKLSQKYNKVFIIPISQ